MGRKMLLISLFSGSALICSAALAGGWGHRGPGQRQYRSAAVWAGHGNSDHGVGLRADQRPEDRLHSRPERPSNRHHHPPGRGRYAHGRRYYWHGRPSYLHGRIYWNLDIRGFPRHGYPEWRAGYWHRGWYGGRWGWWWIVGGIWYYYPTPVYPYPDPYVPGTVVVLQQPESPPAPPSKAPPQYWYHCKAPEGYYPYVPECPGGWTAVPATPPQAAPQPPAGG